VESFGLDFRAAGAIAAGQSETRMRVAWAHTRILDYETWLCWQQFAVSNPNVTESPN
jgi:Fe-S cluster assembly iron-binding protein IscA